MKNYPPVTDQKDDDTEVSWTTLSRMSSTGLLLFLLVCFKMQQSEHAAGNPGFESLTEIIMG